MKDKKNFQTLKKILTAKISEKKTLQGFRENIYSKNSNIKIFILFWVCVCFLYIKGG